MCMFYIVQPLKSLETMKHTEETWSKLKPEITPKRKAEIPTVQHPSH
uniref:Uncharacterized protein n=1 Tax=Rhizophora mucronata TaxID=61149 RepID=A0A2P2PSP6_RHIMU